MAQVHNAVHAAHQQMVRQRVAVDPADSPVQVAIQKPAQNVYPTVYIARQTARNNVLAVRRRFVQTTDGQIAQNALLPRFVVVEAASHVVQIKL